MKKEVVKYIPEEKRNDYNIDISGLVEDDNTKPALNYNEPPKKRGPGRPPKNNNVITYTDIVKADEKSNKIKKDSIEKQYEKGYSDTGKMLYGAIIQADNMYSDIGLELDKYRTNMRYGGKLRSQTMSNYMETQVSLINTKVQAIRELNNIRNKINDLVLKKEQFMKSTGEENSDKAVTDAYYALVNSTRYGLPTVTQPIAPMSINTGINLRGQAVNTSVINQPSMDSLDGIVTDNNTSSNYVIANNNTEDQQFDNYKQNMTNIQRSMIAEKDPNIQTVVIYDQSTGNKYFDVIDVRSGRSVTGIAKPAEFLLDNMRIDFNSGTAFNSNANMSFPLVLVGAKVMDEL